MNRRHRIAVTALASLAVLTLTSAGACGGDSAKSDGASIAAARQNVQLKNDVEGRNYNTRLAMADNPASLIWCSVYPDNPNVKAFTVPIVGKLTSGNKRPTPNAQAPRGGDSNGGFYNPEMPGPDGMYGSSGEYRYGFDPAGNYHEFYNISVYCTSVPTVIQKQTTLIDIGASGDATALDARAQQALQRCFDAAGKNPDGSSKADPSKPCAAAAQILGVG